MCILYTVYYIVNNYEVIFMLLGCHSIDIVLLYLSVSYFYTFNIATIIMFDVKLIIHNNKSINYIIYIMYKYIYTPI